MTGAYLIQNTLFPQKPIQENIDSFATFVQWEDINRFKHPNQTFHQGIKVSIFKGQIHFRVIWQQKQFCQFFFYLFCEGYHLIISFPSIRYIEHFSQHMMLSGTRTLVLESGQSNLPRNKKQNRKHGMILSKLSPKLNFLKILMFFLQAMK